MSADWDRKYVEALVSDIKGDIDNLVRELVRAPISSAKPKPDNRKKLTKREVELIRGLRRSGSTQRDLAVMFEVNPATVSRIVRGIYW